MPINKKYHPDYSKLYPGVDIPAKVLSELIMSDRKMEYMERDLKRDRVLQDANGKTVRDVNGLPVILPEREVSLDKLMEEDWDFPGSSPSPEETVLQRLEVEELLRCLDFLDADERKLIHALFYDRLTERECAGKIALSKTAVHARKIKILEKLKKMMDS